jgi:putative addiction module component (TIGR02574 family)
MSTAEVVEHKLSELMDLPPEARLELGERLIESVPGFADPEVRQAWSQEIARRVKEVDDGLVELIPAEDVLREARERIDAIRRAASASQG